MDTINTTVYSKNSPIPLTGEKPERISGLIGEDHEYMKAGTTLSPAKLSETQAVVGKKASEYSLSVPVSSKRT